MSCHRHRLYASFLAAAASSIDKLHDGKEYIYTDTGAGPFPDLIAATVASGANSGTDYGGD